MTLWNPKWLTPLNLITHLEDIEGEVDYMDITELQNELLKPWDQVEAPTTLFEWGDKYEKQLIKAQSWNSSATNSPISNGTQLVSAVRRIRQSNPWVEFQAGSRQNFQQVLHLWSERVRHASEMWQANGQDIRKRHCKQPGQRGHVIWCRTASSRNDRVSQCSHCKQQCAIRKDDGYVLHKQPGKETQRQESQIPTSRVSSPWFQEIQSRVKKNPRGDHLPSPIKSHQNRSRSPSSTAFFWRLVTIFNFQCNHQKLLSPISSLI